MTGFEPFAIVGAISACSQLGGGFIELTAIIAHAIKGIHHVPQYILDLKWNVQIFEVCLDKFIDASNEAYSNNWYSKDARATAYAVEILLDQWHQLWPKIYELVRKTERARLQTTVSQWLSRIGLAFRQSSVQCLQISLGSLVNNTNLLATTMVLESLLAQIKELRRRKETIPPHLEQKIRQLKRDLAHHKEMAAELRRELQRQASEAGLRDEMAADLAMVRELSHCLRKKVVKVAPELAHQSAGETTRGSATSSSRRGSRVVSNGSSHVASTPRRLPSGASKSSVRTQGSVREESRSPGFSQDLATIPPLVQSPRSYQEAAQEPGAPVDNERLNQQNDAEQASLVNVPSSIIGPVILVSEDNQVNEVHRQWHPEASTPLGDEADGMNNLVPGAPHGSVEECDRGQQRHSLESQMSTRRNSIPPQVGNSSEAVHESDTKQNDLPLKGDRSDSPTSDGLRSPRIRRVRGDIGNVDIFSPPENMAGPGSANESYDPRYKPVAPFNSNDRVLRRRPNSQ